MLIQWLLENKKGSDNLPIVLNIFYSQVYMKGIYRHDVPIKGIYSVISIEYIKIISMMQDNYVPSIPAIIRSRRNRDRMVVGFITTYAISAYHH
jgi:hypothetical protein